MKTKTTRRKLIFATAIAIAMVLTLALTACKALDVVGDESVSAFDKLVEVSAKNDKIAFDGAFRGWRLAAPDGSASFILSEDFSQTEQFDVSVSFPAKPFIEAGLDISKLPKNYYISEELIPDGNTQKTITVGQDIGDKKFEYSDNSKATSSFERFLSAYEQLVKAYPDTINYHTSLDHYGIKLGDGNMFEWAKDMKTNAYDGSNQDKDLVFVLNPEPLIKAGLDPKAVQGWVYAKVPIEEDGKTKEVWKLLKPFDLR